VFDVTGSALTDIVRYRTSIAFTGASQKYICAVIDPTTQTLRITLSYFTLTGQGISRRRISTTRVSAR
jgi:hypothetical protein